MKQYFIKMLFIVGAVLLFQACGRTTGSESSAAMIFEDAEDGLSHRWQVIKGDSSPSQIKAYNTSTYCIHLPVSWHEENGNWYNPHEYHLPLETEDAYVLELDVGGTGEEIPHYVVGVKIESDYGERTILWNSWYNHEGMPAKYTQESATMVFPSPVELVRGFGYEDTTTWSHFRVDIAKALHTFEPDNHITSVSTFIATGGDLDNIGLSQK